MKESTPPFNHVSVEKKKEMCCLLRRVSAIGNEGVN